MIRWFMNIGNKAWRPSLPRATTVYVGGQEVEFTWDGTIDSGLCQEVLGAYFDFIVEQLKEGYAIDDIAKCINSLEVKPVIR